MKVKIEVLKVLKCYTPTCLSIENGKTISSPNDVKKYYKSDGDEFFSEQENHYPMIIDPDGCLWLEGNLYLLSKIKRFNKVSYRTIESIARDLAYFRQWALDEEIDYLTSPKRPRKRPTYQYTFYLHDEVRFQNIQKSTAKRRLSSVINFYRWLISKGYQFEYPLWAESDASLSFTDSRGFRQQKKFTSTDLIKTFRTSKSSEDYSDCIQDGGKLRPLPKTEQEVLIHSLINIGNTEMTLAFFLALTTGARKQTIFTLRQSSFTSMAREKAQFVRIKVGNGTLIDTKYGKQMVILIPTWLYEKIRIYLKSDRYQKRHKNAIHQFSNSEDQYVFLTKSGKPYYASNSDHNNRLYSSPPKGNAITQFIRQQLMPEIEKQGYEFRFRFHDLRATFGMNLLEGKLNQVEHKYAFLANSPDYFQVLMYLRERMGHSQISTTEAYLNYKEKYKLTMNVQSEYERHLQHLMDK